MCARFLRPSQSLFYVTSGDFRESQSLKKEVCTATKLVLWELPEFLYYSIVFYNKLTKIVCTRLTSLKKNPRNFEKQTGYGVKGLHPAHPTVRKSVRKCA